MNDPMKNMQQAHDAARKSFNKQQQAMQGQMTGLARARQGGGGQGSSLSRALAVIIFLVIVGVIGYALYSGAASDFFNTGGGTDGGFDKYQVCINAGQTKAYCSSHYGH